MKVTNETLPIVLGMIKKISKKYPILNTQLEYPAHKRNNVNRRKAGLSVFNVEKSNVHSFKVKEAMIHDSILKDYVYININNQGESIDFDRDYCFDNDNDNDKYWKATVINTDCEVIFKNNVLIIKQEHPTNKNMIAIEKIWFTK